MASLIKAPYPDGGGASSLLTGLSAYWPFEEASGNRLDSTAHHYDFAPTAAPGNAAGRVGQALALNGSTQFLTLASNADVQGGAADRTWVCWVYLTSASTGRVWSKDDGGANREYLLQYDSGSGQWLWASWHGGTIAVLNATTFGAVPLNTWHLVIVTWTSASKRLAISVNAGTEDTATVSTTTLDAGTADLLIGTFAGSPTFFPGRVDEAGIWGRVLTSGERTSLYNAGAGRTYPFVGG